MMDISGWTKLIVCVTCCIAAVVLGGLSVIDGQACTGILTATLGYVFGNGHGVLSAKKTEK